MPPSHSPLIHYCCLQINAEAELQLALEELAAQLQEHFPQVPPLTSAQLAAELLPHVPNYLSNNLPGVYEDDIHPQLEVTRLLVLMADDHPFVATAQMANPAAVWGIAVLNCFAAAWVDNKYLWWHEALHLLGARDCYTKFGRHKCEQPCCIMQRAPTEETCAGRLHLCKKNLARIMAV